MKISMWAVWVAILSLFFSISYGFDVCADSNIQTTPAISGTTIVWADSRLGIANIYCKYLNEPNDFALSSSNKPQVNPDIDGNIVVWVEDGDIFGYDLANSTTPRVEVCTGSGAQTPAISRNLVVWAEGGDIYGRYLNSGSKFAICTAGGTQSEPAVDSNIVVWRDTRNGNDDIYGKNLSTGQFIEICVNTSNQAKPKISGQLVVWQDYRDKTLTSTDIYGRYLYQQNDFSICTAAGAQNFPDVYGDIVVWKYDTNVYYCDVSQAGYQARLLTTDNYNNNNMVTPRISNYTVVWENQTIEGGNIYGAFLLSSDTTTLNITNPQAGQTIWNGKPLNIQWQADPNLIGVVNIEISVAAEPNYSPIATTILNTGSYEWIPDEPNSSENCRIKVTAVAGRSANVETGIFTIAKCSDKLTADFNGDCTVDTADFAAFSAQWLHCGNLSDDNCIE